MVSLENNPKPVHVPFAFLTIYGVCSLFIFHLVPSTFSYPIYVQVNVNFLCTYTEASVGVRFMLLLRIPMN